MASAVNGDAMKRPLMLTPVLVFAFLAACSQHPDTHVTKDNGMLKGVARVVSVNDDVGTVTLEIEGKKVPGYWELDRSFAQAGAVVKTGPMKAPVGDYHEPIVQRQGFPAQPG